MEKPSNLNTISVEVPLTPAYNNKHLTLNTTRVKLDIELTEGEHRLVTPLMEVGLSPWFGTIQARLTLWYRYDSKEQSITFCGSDLISDNSLCLTTVSSDRSEYSLQYTHNGTHSVESINRGWNHTSQLTPGLEDALRQTVREANQLIIGKAIELDFIVTELSPLPLLTQDIYERLSSVFYHGEFLEYYDPEKTYGPGHTLRTIDSTGYGTTTLPAGQLFSNVLLSTNDPQINSQSWIALWESQFGATVTCTSFNYSGFTCSAPGIRMCGGHTITGTVAYSPLPGANNVLILPICPGHNRNWHTTMKALKNNRKAITLQGYMQ